MLNEIRIGNRLIGQNHPVFVIAEAGINHNGSFSIAKKLVDVAKKAGADCIKFQTHITEEEMTKTNILPGKISKTPLWDIIKSCELTEDEELKLNKYCKEKKILFLSTPFSIPAVDRLEKIHMPAYKIGSGELTNLPFLKHIAKKGKPVILSSGMSNMNEIKAAVSLFKKHKTPLALLQTTSEYPCDYKDVNLGVLDIYKKLFCIPIGISDHSLGIYTALGAVAKGASIVEKHITLNKRMPGPDQKLSLEPHELAELVKGCRAIKLALGSTKKILKKELPVLRFARESVVTLKKISKGDVFSEKNLTTKRPSTGQIPAKDYYKILGRKAKRNIPQNQQLRYSDIL
ncbi:MAG: N-acetylneuraminate synthase family protein [Thermoproteota archaeon]